MLVAVFACFLHRRKSIANGVQTQQNFLEIFFGPEDIQWAKEIQEGCPEGGTTHLGVPGGPSVPSWVVPTSMASRTASLPYKLPNIQTKPQGNPISEVPPPQASVAMQNQSRPHSGTLPEGEIINCGHLHHPDGHHDEDRVVHL